jgi:hypothetical protein
MATITDYRLSGAMVRRLMRKHGVTIRALAAKHGILLKRVREVRATGARGFLANEWPEFDELHTFFVKVLNKAMYGPTAALAA